MAVTAQEKENKLKSMSDAVKVVIDNYPVRHQFYGNELHDDVAEIYPEARNMYVDTVLKMARRHRRKSYICVDRNNSLYKRVKSDIELIKEKSELEAKKRAEAEKHRPKQISSVVQFPLFGGIYG